MTASVPFTAPLMPPLTGASTSVRFLGFESFRDQLGARRVRWWTDRSRWWRGFRAMIPSGPKRDGLDDVRRRQAGRARYPLMKRPRRAILQDVHHAQQAVWSPRSACRKSTTNSRRRAIARPSVRPCGPFRQSRLSLPPSLHPLSRRVEAGARVVLVCSGRGPAPGRSSPNVQIVSQSVKHKILVSTGYGSPD